MFKKWVHNDNDSAHSTDKTLGEEQVPADETVNPEDDRTKKNTILKGSKLIGDITISCDMELNGEIEGNITSSEKSNIVIKGICKGNIDAREGSVDIDGEFREGNITAGKDVKISGKFNGGEIKANGRINLNGEFRGKLEAGEIEIGAGSRGTGEIFYRDYISIARGAVIKGQICKLPAELTLVKGSREEKKITEEFPVRRAKNA